MNQEDKVKSVYVYLIPKSKWPKTPGGIRTARFGGYNIDYYEEKGIETVVGIEVLEARSVEIDGRQVSRELLSDEKKAN